MISRSGVTWALLLVVLRLGLRADPPAVWAGVQAGQSLQRLLAAREARLNQQATSNFESTNEGRWLHFGPDMRAREFQLLPAFLLRELGSKSPWLLCREAGFALRPARVRQKPKMAGSARDAARVASAFRYLRLGHGRVCEFDYYIGGLNPLGFYYPAIIDWHGTVAGHGGVAWAAWREPALATQLQLCSPPQPRTEFIAWGRTGAKLSQWSQRGMQHAVSFRYPRVAGVNDGSPGNCRLALDSWPIVVSAAQLRPVVGASSGGGCLFRGPINWPGGLGRTERFFFDKGAIARVTIVQPAIQLEEPAGNPFTVTVQAGGRAESVRFRAVAKVPYLRGGRVITIGFSSARHAPGVALPSYIRFRRGSAVTLVARYLRLHYQRGSLPAGPPLSGGRARQLTQVDGRLASLGIWPGAQARAHPAYFNAAQLAPTLPGYLVRRRIFYNAYAAAYKSNWPELATTLRCYRRLLYADHIPYVYYLYSVESLVSGMCKMVGAKQANVGTLAKEFLEPAYARLAPEDAVRQVARLVGQYHYGFALVALSAIRRNGRCPAQIRAWAGFWRRKLLRLIGSIDETPQKYRIYFLEKFLTPWKSFTLVNHAIGMAYGLSPPLRPNRTRPAQPAPHRRPPPGPIVGPRGLHEISLALQSAGAFTQSQRRVLERIAGQVLSKYGPLSESKLKVAYAQTREYVLWRMNGDSKPSAKSFKLFSQFFKYDLAAFVRLPSVNKSQLRRAAAIFRVCYEAMRRFVDETYTDTPKAIKARLAARVGRYMRKAFARDACNYFDPQMLYPNHGLPSLKHLVKEFKAYPFAYLNPRAFAPTQRLSASNDVSKVTKRIMVSQYVTIQSSRVEQRVQEILMKYFHGNDYALFAAGAGRYPGRLVEEWNALGEARFAREARRMKLLMGRTLYSGLLPRSRNVFVGSGVPRW